MSVAIYEIIELIEKGLYDRALTELQNLGNQSHTDQVFSNLLKAEIQLFRGDFDSCKQQLIEIESNLEDKFNDLRIYHINLLLSLFIQVGDTILAVQLIQQTEQKVHYRLDTQKDSLNEMSLKIIARYFHTLGNVYLNLGKLNDATLQYTHSINIKKNLDDPKGMASTLNKLGLVHRLKGELEISLAFANQSVEIDISLGNQQAVAVTQRTIGIIFRDMNEDDLAIENFKRSLVALSSINNPLLLAESNFELFTTLISIDKKLADDVYDDLHKLSTENTDNNKITLITSLAEAILLKHSQRGRDKYRAQELLKLLTGLDHIDFRLNLLTKMHLVDLLLDEFKNYGGEEVLLELVELLESIRITAKDNNSHLIAVEIMLIEARFELAKGDIAKADYIYTEVNQYAQMAGLPDLIDKTESEKDAFDKEIEQWTQLADKGASVMDSLKDANIENYLANVMKLMASV